jgi:hypothetical protein
VSEAKDLYWFPKLDLKKEILASTGTWGKRRSLTLPQDDTINLTVPL